MSMCAVVPGADASALTSGTVGHPLLAVEPMINVLNDVRHVGGAGLFEVAVRTAECLHYARRCDDGMRALACAWHIVCSAGVTDPKLVASCLVRLGTADLTCGCRPTAIAASRRRRGRDAAVLGERLTLDQALAELVALIGATPRPPVLRMPGRS